MQDDGPDQTQGQFGVSICDVIVPDVHQFDLKQEPAAERRLQTNGSINGAVLLSH